MPCKVDRHVVALESGREGELCVAFIVGSSRAVDFARQSGDIIFTT
jgi:hypothetical protein